MQSGSPSICHMCKDLTRYTQKHAALQEQFVPRYLIMMRGRDKRMWGIQNTQDEQRLHDWRLSAVTHTQRLTATNWHHSLAGCVCVLNQVSPHRGVNAWLPLDTVAMFSHSLPFKTKQKWSWEFYLKTGSSVTHFDTMLWKGQSNSGGNAKLNTKIKHTSPSN